MDAHIYQCTIKHTFRSDGPAAQHFPPFHATGCELEVSAVSKWPPDLESFVITSRVCCASVFSEMKAVTYC